MTNGTSDTALLERMRQSPLLRIILIGFLILLLQIPILLIRGIIGERESRQREAIREITSKWGEQQSIVGPIVTVPYTVEISETDKEGNVTLDRKSTRLNSSHYS